MSNGYASSCRICSMNKKPNARPKTNLKLYHAGFPMERVHVDLLGPFIVSSQGNKYILMIDQLTIWLECIPIPDQNAETVAQTSWLILWSALVVHLKYILIKVNSLMVISSTPFVTY